jgi:hypothetical protein
MQTVPSRRSVLQAPRAALHRHVARETGHGLGPLPRRRFLRHLTQTSVEHGAAVTLWSHSIRHGGLVSPLLRTLCRRVLDPVDEFGPPS